MPQYTFTEPHPTARDYIHSGRGGAGNTFKAPKTSYQSSTRDLTSLFEIGIPQTSSKISSGRGGAGNIRQNPEKKIFSFNEELERQSSRRRKINEGEIYHVGRGGAGNWSTSQPQYSRKDSSFSTDSGASGFFGRLSATFDRR